jgi:hypothetical protein
MGTITSKRKANYFRERIICSGPPKEGLANTTQDWMDLSPIG